VRLRPDSGRKTGVKSTPTRRSILATLLIAIVAPCWSCAPKKSATAEKPVLVSAAGASATPVAAKPVAPAPPPLRLLFVGNSYTFYNGGVPAVLAAMAKSRGRDVDAVSSVSGGKTLQWHWEQGTARESIANGGPWDYVVLQEYSTRPIEDALAMSDYARKFGDEIRKAGAKTVLFLTWARYNQPENQAVLTQAYDKVGRELGAVVVRVGPAWERVIDEKPSIKLHMADRSHPTPEGTYLAAAVFYATLLHDSPVGLPATLQLGSGGSARRRPRGSPSRRGGRSTRTRPTG
jgi:hypothetical protein